MSDRTQRFVLNMILSGVIIWTVPGAIEPHWNTFAGGLLAGYVTLTLLRLVDRLCD